VVLYLLLPLLLPIPDVSVAADLPFKVGEKLNFKIYFEFILGGDARMEVEGLEEIGGEQCLRIVSEAKSTRTVDAFYKVRDRIVTWRDLDGGYSRKYTKRLREGKWKDDKQVDYRPETNELFLSRKEGAQAEKLALEKPVHDVLSAFYEVRLHPLEVGKSVFLDVHDIDKQYKLEVRVLRKEVIEVPAGQFDCFVIEPLLQSSGIFRKEGTIQVWLTDDESRMPVLMQSRLYFGRVWAKLVDYRKGEKP
jgi:hypothetical protein